MNNNKLPKINLIGHSRGGITNMQYALDHPDLVASIYSLGTPYLGTTSGAVGYAFKPSLLCSNQAANDILNPSVYESYMKRWNEGYDEYYKNIKVNAFAGYSTGDQIISLLATDALWEEFIDGYSTWNEFAKSSFKAGAVSIAEAGYVLMMKSLFTGGVMTKIAVEKLLTGILNEIIKSIPIDSSKIPVFDFVQILTNEINFDYHFPFISWYNDGCVDLGSALGYVGLFPLDGQGYKGFNRTTKAFGAFNCDMNALSRDMPPVVHNLEARDKELNNYILADINLGSSTNDYLVRNVYDANGNETNEVYIDQFLAECDGNTLTIPSSIYGKTVVGISDYAFANNCYGKSGITTINIPDSVRYIGKNAFYNSDSIATINIGEDSELSEIRDYAFSNIPNLLTFTIPSSLKQIGDCAFLYSGIEIFTCENNRYDWIDNVLVDKNSYLNGTSENNYDAIYVNSKIENLRMPDFVKSIDNYV